MIRINEKNPGLRLWILFDKPIDAGTLGTAGYVIRLRDAAKTVTGSSMIDARTVRLDVTGSFPDPGPSQVVYSSPPGTLAGLDSAPVASYTSPIIEL